MKYIVAGDGPLANVLTLILDAAHITDGNLRVQAAESAQNAHNIHTVIVVISPMESPSSLVWRHRQLWRWRERHGILAHWRWVICSCAVDQLAQMRETDVLGRISVKTSFASWEESKIRFVSASDGLKRLLPALSSAEPVAPEAWSTLQRRDQSAAILRDFQRFLSQSPTPLALVNAAKVLELKVPRLALENYCAGPNKHAQANALWGWITAVARGETLDFQRGEEHFVDLLL